MGQKRKEHTAWAHFQSLGGGSSWNVHQHRTGHAPVHLGAPFPSLRWLVMAFLPTRSSRKLESCPTWFLLHPDALSGTVSAGCFILCFKRSGHHHKCLHQASAWISLDQYSETQISVDTRHSLPKFAAGVGVLEHRSAYIVTTGQNPCFLLSTYWIQCKKLASLAASPQELCGQAPACHSSLIILSFLYLCL